MEEWEYLKDVEANRRRGEISDTAAAVLSARKGGDTSTRALRLAGDEVDTLSTVQQNSKQCPGCPARIQKIEYASPKLMVTSTLTACLVDAITFGVSVRFPAEMPNAVRHRPSLRDRVLLAVSG